MGSKLYPAASRSTRRMDGAKCLLSDDFGPGKRFGGAIASHIGSFFLSSIKRPGGARLLTPFVRIVEPKPRVYLEVTPLRGETKERWRELCERAVVEEDPDRFLAIIRELIQVLEDNEERRRNATGLRAPPSEKPADLTCSVNLSTHVWRTFPCSVSPVLFIQRVNVIAGAPFDK
jgi:hypothetical protein